MQVKDDTFKDYPSNLPRSLFPVLVEVSTSCDFAQAKCKLPRFVAGFLFPEEAQPHFRSKAAYLKKIGPLYLRNRELPLDGIYYLALNAHYICGVRSKLARQLRPTMRLRSGVLGDLIAWIAAHFSRPGYLFVDPSEPEQPATAVPTHPAIEQGVPRV